jgi:hypothetical protein
MPELTIHVNDGDLAHLEKMGTELGHTAQRMAERLVHRTLVRRYDTPVRTHKQRSSDRAMRQLELLRMLRRRRLDTLNQADKQALARKFGVAERTIYRDLEVLQRTRDEDARAGAKARADRNRKESSEETDGVPDEEPDEELDGVLT